MARRTKPAVAALPTNEPEVGSSPFADFAATHDAWLYCSEDERAVLAEAVRILTRVGRERNPVEFSSPKAAAHLCGVHFAGSPYESFAIWPLDTQHRLLTDGPLVLFRGTIDGASVYPREVVREVMRLNASAVLLSHHHPSGSPEISLADRQITRRLCDTLALIDVKIIDHIVTGSRSYESFAEKGLL